MGDDPNFRLKAFAVIACMLGVFLCSYVAQRVYFWWRTRKRDDVETTPVAPFIDFGLLGLGAVIIWISVEALVLAIVTSKLNVQPTGLQKIAEVEVSKLDRDTNQTNLLFYRVDSAGRRRTDQRRPVLTSGTHFVLQIDVVTWRGMWSWLGETGFYRFVALGGVDSPDAPAVNLVSLDAVEMPGGVGQLVFLNRPEPKAVSQPCAEGEVYDILFDAESQYLTVRPHP